MKTQITFIALAAFYAFSAVEGLYAAAPPMPTTTVASMAVEDEVIVAMGDDGEDVAKTIEAKAKAWALAKCKSGDFNYVTPPSRRIERMVLGDPESEVVVITAVVECK